VGCRYHVYRQSSTESARQRLTDEPIPATDYIDADVEMGQPYRYQVSSVTRRGVESQPSGTLTATATVIMDPVFALPLNKDLLAHLYPDAITTGQAHGAVAIRDDALDLSRGGYVTFANDSCFGLSQPLTVTCRVRLDQPGEMPVVLSCGAWQQAGWFLQRLGNQWRWYVGGLNCDGGAPEIGTWYQLTATFDGRTARLYQDGQLVAEAAGPTNRDAWGGDLLVGQYSGQPAPPYQSIGVMRDVRIYHRVLSPAEIRAGL
jgi:hypothetical protein